MRRRSADLSRDRVAFMTGQLRSGADSFPSFVCMGRRSADLSRDRIAFMTGQLRSFADSFFSSSSYMRRRSADLRCFAGFLFLLWPGERIRELVVPI
ncbi:uncharacterized protein LOC103999389 isoform X2 [Musa acuminata AAA Group]|uniref:uncharacterized protein LOC135623835 isoform X2 n=1 Tax=Musa acuminata AAA Group TaxID=214697 RepID=UPI0031DE1F7B